jgi:hypothetical protein
MTVKQYFEVATKGMHEQVADLPVPEVIEGLSLTAKGDFTYRQIVDLRDGLEKQLSEYETALLIGRLFCGADVSGWDFSLFVPYMLMILKYNEQCIKYEIKNLKYTPTANEKAAGVEKLGKFKDWAVVSSICKTYHGYKHEEVYNLLYTTVLAIQEYDLAVSKFERKLTKIENAK